MQNAGRCYLPDKRCRSRMRTLYFYKNSEKKYEDKVKTDFAFTWNRYKNGYPAIIALYRQCCLNNPRLLQLQILHSLLQTVK